MTWISVEFVPVAGKPTTLFQKQVDDLRIVFGAQRDCDVCIETDMQPKIAFRDHCAIERPENFELIYKAKNPVWLDGKLVTSTQQLFPGDMDEHWLWLAQRPPVDPPGKRLREKIDPEEAGLAGKGHFHCLLHDDPAKVPPPAGWRRHGPSGDTGDRRIETGLRRTQWLILAGAGVTSLVVGGGIGFFVRPSLDSIQKEQAETRKQIADATKATEELLVPVLETTAFRERAEKSIYVVGSIADGKFSPGGTAWVADLGGPRLISNHHVGDLLKAAAANPDTKIVARRTVALGKIEDIDLSPDYSGHPAFERFAPVLDALGSRGEHWPNQFDVAELPLKDEADRARLGPVLSISTDLSDIAPLQSVGYVGFPVEGLNVTKFNPSEPSASFVPGKIIKVTDAFQRSLVPNAYRNLVQVQLTAVGGASGSPLFDARGRVIGMISGGDVRGGSSDTGAGGPREASGFAYAIRADVIEELGGAPEPEDRQAQWDCALEQFAGQGAGACGSVSAGAPQAATPDGTLDKDGRAQKRIRLGPGRYVVKAQAASPALLHLKASWGNGRSTQSDSEPTTANRPELSLRLTQADEVTFDLQGVPGDEYSLSHQLAGGGQ